MQTREVYFRPDPPLYGAGLDVEFMDDAGQLRVGVIQSQGTASLANHYWIVSDNARFLVWEYRVVGMAHAAHAA